jgi:hypothetical protein
MHSGTVACNSRGADLGLVIGRKGVLLLGRFMGGRINNHLTSARARGDAVFSANAYSAAAISISRWAKSLLTGMPDSKRDPRIFFAYHVGKKFGEGFLQPVALVDKPA